jgi:orotidine-5'-phosphate decarboxylase
VTVSFQGSANADLASKLAATLKANLPVVYSLEARLAAMAGLVESLKGNVAGVADIKVACVPQVVAAAAQALSDVQASGSASVSLTKSVAQ